MLGFEKYFQTLVILMQMKEEKKRREKELQNGKEELCEFHPKNKKK